MMKVVFAKEVRVSDVIKFHELSDLGEVKGVREDDYSNSSHIQLLLEGQGGLRIASEHPIVLCHRPWPKGKTEQDMLQEVIEATRSFGPLGVGVRSQLSEKLSKLRQALDAYELGKSFDLSQSNVAAK